MGLINMLVGSVKSELADQVREYIYCDSLPDEVLMRKGSVRNATGNAAHSYGSTNNASDNVISKGSAIAVNEGQFMLVVEDGKIVDFTDEPGSYIFDKSTEPSMLYGGFGEGLLESFKNVGKRFTFGGDTGKDQRVYFINKKLITNNKFGTPTPVPYRDPEFSLTINMTCNGTYVIKVVDPILFYTNLCANVTYEYRITEEFMAQFKSDLLSGFRPALAKVSMQKVPFDMLAAAEDQLTKATKEVLYENWELKTGINVDRISIMNLSPVDDANYQTLIKYQASRVYTDANMANAMKSQAQVNWMEGMGEGASQGGGGNADPMSGMMSMMGMNMMNQMMGGGMFNGQQAQGSAPQNATQQAMGMPQNNMQAPSAVESGAWTCTCGHENNGKFCMECGSAKPAPVQANTWVCACGETVSSKFCPNCGSRKASSFKCNKCGWVPTDMNQIPKFCPECGDVFNDEDIQ
ncbi:MAG: SPFH domain-containing protein [Lachnospiraceae bacterium]